MTKQAIISMFGSAAGILGVVVVASLPIWGVHACLSVLAGGLWNLVNLWCLTRLLQAWLGPSHSRRRALEWLLVKFPALYLVVFTLLASPTISPLGFGVGFTVVLTAMGIVLAFQVQHPILVGSHER